MTAHNRVALEAFFQESPAQSYLARLPQDVARIIIPYAEEACIVIPNYRVCCAMRYQRPHGPARFLHHSENVVLQRGCFDLGVKVGRWYSYRRAPAGLYLWRVEHYGELALLEGVSYYNRRGKKTRTAPGWRLGWVDSGIYVVRCDWIAPKKSVVSTYSPEGRLVEREWLGPMALHPRDYTPEEQEKAIVLLARVKDVVPGRPECGTCFSSGLGGGFHWRNTCMD